MVRVRMSLALLLVLGLTSAGRSVLAADSQTLAADEQTLKAAGLVPTGPGLLEFFQKRTQVKVERQNLAALVHQLGDKTPAIRDRAAGELISLGLAAVPLLRQAANELDDSEAAGRARQCLQSIEGNSGASLTAAAVRCLTAQKPVGTVEALLSYLPLAEDDRVVEEITTALAETALRNGKPEAALLKALQDPLPIRRVVAGEVLAKVGGDAERIAVRKLLQDPKPTVRLRVALTLAQYHDAEVVPVLIALIAELPPAQAHPIEEFLAGLAGEWAIAVPQGDDAMARRLRRELWMAWWNATDGPAILEEIKKRTPSDAEREKIHLLVLQLCNSEAAKREKATAELVALGPSAVPLLRQAANDPDGKASEPAKKCLQLLDATASPPLPAVTARLLALRKPPGGAEAILAFLPGAEDENMTNELCTALGILAVAMVKRTPPYSKPWRTRCRCAGPRPRRSCALSPTSDRPSGNCCKIPTRLSAFGSLYSWEPGRNGRPYRC